MENKVEELENGVPDSHKDMDETSHRLVTRKIAKEMRKRPRAPRTQKLCCQL